MFKLLVVVASIVVSANAANIVASSGFGFATSPALGAPLLSKVTYNAPEVTVVKQPVTIDQHETRYVPQPVVIQNAPIVRTYAAPLPVHHQYAALPVAHHQYSLPLAHHSALPLAHAQFASPVVTLK